MASWLIIGLGVVGNAADQANRRVDVAEARAASLERQVDGLATLAGIPITGETRVQLEGVRARA
jgi:hypothetical protein